MINGGTSGIGQATATALARSGAAVILSARDAARGAGALARLAEHAPGSAARFESLNLADLGSIRAFAGRLADRHDRLDILLNNASIVAPHRQRLTRDGFEMQFGVNHLGQFALTAWLLPLLRRAGEGRVVGVTSLSHRMGRLNFGDLQA